MSSSISNSEFRRYLTYLSLFSVPVLLLLALNLLYLNQSGELMSVKEIVDEQQTGSGFCIYGDALKSLTHPYKMETYSRRHPEIIVLGSSRVLPFRERFFAHPFYNFGSAMTNLNEGMDVMEDILKSGMKPKTVIIGIDFWWFNGDFVPPTPYRPIPKPVPQFEGYYVFKPFQWIWDGKITIDDYLKTLLGRDDAHSCNIGIAAIKNRSGFGPDGSYYDNVSAMPPPVPAGAEAFAEVTDVLKNTGRFAEVRKADAQHMETFLRLITLLTSNGIDVNVVFLPFPSPIFAAMQRDLSRYAIFDELKAVLQKAGVLTLDATNPASIGTGECEFGDSVHAGDVAAARLILRLDAGRRTAGLPPIGDTTFLKKTVDNNAGLTMARDSRVTDAPEVDFLHLGCKK